MKKISWFGCFMLFFCQAFCVPPGSLPEGILSRRYVANWFELERSEKALKSIAGVPEEIKQQCSVKLVKQLADQINKRNDLDFLLCALEFCRSRVCSGTKLDFFDRINVCTDAENGLDELCWKALETNINDAQKKYSTTRETAAKLSLLTVFKLPWKSSIALLGLLCKEGGFSHKHTFETALLVLHMCPQRSFLDAFSYIFTRKNEDDVILYASCLAGAMATVLKEEGKMKDFSFDIDIPFSTKKDLVIYNVKKLLMKYWEIVIRETQENEEIIKKREKQKEKEKEITAKMYQKKPKEKEY
jgi:hypothetical protein